MLAAAARRVEGRFEANKGGNGPSPTPAAPPCEDAPVWAAFPELSAAGRGGLEQVIWRCAHVELAENRMVLAVALSKNGEVDVARGSHPGGPQVLALVPVRRLSRPHLAPRRSRPTFEPRR